MLPGSRGRSGLFQAFDGAFEPIILAIPERFRGEGLGDVREYSPRFQVVPLPREVRCHRRHHTVAKADFEKGLRIVQQFEDVETAKRAGHMAFDEMVTFLREAAGSCRILLVVLGRADCRCSPGGPAFGGMPWHDERTSPSSALDILKRRYASGEITREQYDQMRKDFEWRLREHLRITW